MNARLRESLRGEPRALVLRTIAVFAAYFLAARLGISLALGADPVSLVWPASGIGLAAVLLLGRPAAIGVAAGSFAANWSAGAGASTSALMAAGGAAEALVGAWLLDRVVRFDRSLERFRDVAGLIVVASAVVPLTAALVGALALCAGGAHAWPAFGALWREWWLGDAIGVFVLAPVLLAWGHASARFREPRRVAEGVLLGGLLLIACSVAYGARFGTVATRYPLEYVAFPFLVWAALRFGPAMTASVTLVVSSVAVAATYRGQGPFQAGALHDRVVLLQLYVLVLSLTGLSLGAEMAGRRRAEDRLRADQVVGHILATSKRLQEATLHIARALCQTLRWDFAAVWVLDRGANVLRCADVWRDPRLPSHEFEAVTRCLTAGPDTGLPGRVWMERRPVWIQDAARDVSFPRSAAARRAGLHAAFAFPLIASGEVVGVVELFSRRAQPPDRRLLDVMHSVGGRIGQFIERADVEARLRESEERFRFLAETIPSIAWIASPNGDVLYANPRWEQYCGAPATQQNWLDRVVHPDDRERCLETWRWALATGEPFEVEARNRRHDGEYHWFLTRALPRKDEHGRVISWFGMTTDVHAAKSLEERLREADRRKDEFLATLAHELRNPLAPVSNALHVLEAAGDDPAVRTEALALARRQLDNLVRLVDDLLDVSRITRGKIRLRRERAVETVEPLVAKRRQRLEVHVPEGPVWVDADPTRIAQVVSNLLNNASKYSDVGGTIRVVLESAAPSANEVELTVEDEGIGIAAHMLERIFEPFVQDEGAADRAQGGLGIGLTLVRQLVRLHGGSVEAHSDGPGRGSRFVVRLPLAAPAAAPAEPVRVDEPPGASDAATPRRILVVDDNVDSATTMRLVLESMGHEVRVAHDGEAGIDAALSFAPDLVLLDIGLPRVDGYEAARTIRRRAGASAPLLVAVTGWDRPEDRARARDAGFDHHVTKPVSPETLRRIIETSLARPAPAGG